LASRLYELIPLTTTQAMNILAPDQLKQLQSTCLQLSIEALPNLISRLYIDKMFNKQAIEDMRTFVNDLKEAFNQLLEENKWMDSTTKMNAISKLKAISVNIASPDFTFNDKELQLYSNDVRFFTYHWRKF